MWNNKFTLQNLQTPSYTDKMINWGAAVFRTDSSVGEKVDCGHGYRLNMMK